MTQMIMSIDLRPGAHLQAKLDMAYDRVMNSGRYIGGAEVEAFEQEWAGYVGTKYCVAVANGTDALQLALMAVNARVYDAVKVSPRTFVATWQAIRAAGSYPIVHGMDTPVEVVVHLYGIISPRPDAPPPVFLIEDAAQAHGAEWNGRKAGSLADAAAWSFYPTKNLGAFGDAGAVTTNNAFIAERVRFMANYGGMSGGINSRMDPLQAAFLRVKLPYLDVWNENRRQNAACYNECLRGIEGVALPFVPDGCDPCWHQYAIRAERRDELKEYLKGQGVDTLIHYPVPPHRLIGSGYELPEVDDWAAHTLSLPIAPHIILDDVRYIADCVRRFYEG